MRISNKIALCVASVLVPVAAQAGTATTSIVTTASVVSSCTIGSAPLPFANYSGAVVNTTTNLSPNCSSGTPYTIAIDSGANSATTATRKMSNGSTTLDYNLYTTVGATVVWGTVTGTDTVANTGTGTTQTITVYGRIAAGQSSAVGTGYTDTVGVTLTF